MGKVFDPFRLLTPVTLSCNFSSQGRGNGIGFDYVVAATLTLQFETWMSDLPSYAVFWSGFPLKKYSSVMLFLKCLRSLNILNQLQGQR